MYVCAVPRAGRQTCQAAICHVRNCQLRRE